MRLVCEFHGERREGEGILFEADRHVTCWYWTHGAKALRYRLRKPRGLTILQGLILDAREGVDA